jgi:DNA recombination protein RmuC
MNLATTVLIGLLIGIVSFFVFYFTVNRERSAVSALVSGVKGEERLRLLEQNLQQSLFDVRSVVATIDKARGESLARLDALVGRSHETIQALQRSTAKLAETLSSSQARGQLGERLADDVLRAAGFVEGMNYRRNARMDGGTMRPDFTFLLPENRTLNMDVKFPLASYVRYVELQDGAEREQAERQFLNDVRTTIRSVASRDYIDPSRGTLGFMIVFVPNEHIYSFIHGRDTRLSEEARELGVVLCSPMTLFTLLSVIRQASEAFALASDADEVLQALSGFTVQWDKYQKAVDSVGRKIDSLQKTFEDLRGTRTRGLDKQLARVDRLRQQRLFPVTELTIDDPDDEEP